MKEYLSFNRTGTEPHRSYYIPFGENDTVGEIHGIIDRKTSSRFFSLDGLWLIKVLECPEDFTLNDTLSEEIPVPSCVQLHGYDRIQYLNCRYPFPVKPPYVPTKNPSWHYRKSFDLSKTEGQRYYLNFEGVDSAFYLYVNGSLKGFSQISHATSEFDITELVTNGENTIDVLVLKWCASTYLECQDKFRLSGIFRSVYILTRPEGHITDYKINTALTGSDGILSFTNESDCSVSVEIEGQTIEISPHGEGYLTVKNITPWTSESPVLYNLSVRCAGEVIYERIGFREISVDGKVFKINGIPVKLKGVNRHDFNCDTGATVTLDNLAEDVRLIKELNVNAVRTSHYPNAPEFYLLCDSAGLYVMDEADLEMHGACCREGGYDNRLWSEFAEDELFAPGITDRHRALVERDKNRTSVIIWSLGNESSFGKAFFEGAAYIRERDSRPIHYEGIRWADPKYYFSEYVDIFSMMYPSLSDIREIVLDNPKENRPFVMCEYTHAMGNSCGDICDYWRMIDEEEQMMGGFVWEWADHGIRTADGFFYGGDFGEDEHDGNFCIDGILTPDRKYKSSTLEMKAVYGGKRASETLPYTIPEITENGKKLSFTTDPHTGEVVSLTVEGKEVLRTPIHLNTLRYTDNDNALKWHLRDKIHIEKLRPYIVSSDITENKAVFKGFMGAPTLSPAVEFILIYTAEGNTFTVEMEYALASYVEYFPRFGIEFGIGKKFNRFSYIGYGPTESYIDKHIACDYGYFESCAEDNYDRRYVRPQESGSHFDCRYLSLEGLCAVTGAETFSFSVNPYTTKQLFETAHDHSLTDNDFINVCIDVAMRGIGSSSCGPLLEKKYEIPRNGKNIIRFAF